MVQNSFGKKKGPNKSLIKFFGQNKLLVKKDDSPQIFGPTKMLGSKTFGFQKDLGYKNLRLQKDSHNPNDNTTQHNLNTVVGLVTVQTPPHHL